MTAADWIKQRREIAVSDALWHHADGGVIVEEIPGTPCTCSPHFGAHEPHCGIEYVTRVDILAVAAPIVDARNSLPLALDALEAAIGAMSRHWDYVMAQAAKFGRTVPDCVCDACKAMQAIESALGIEAGDDQ